MSHETTSFFYFQECIEEYSNVCFTQFPNRRPLSIIEMEPIAGLLQRLLIIDHRVVVMRCPCLSYLPEEAQETTGSGPRENQTREYEYTVPIPVASSPLIYPVV